MLRGQDGGGREKRNLFLVPNHSMDSGRERRGANTTEKKKTRKERAMEPTRTPAKARRKKESCYLYRRSKSRQPVRTWELKTFGSTSDTEKTQGTTAIFSAAPPMSKFLFALLLKKNETSPLPSDAHAFISRVGRRFRQQLRCSRAYTQPGQDMRAGALGTRPPTSARCK